MSEDSLMNSPAQIVDVMIQSGETKAALPIGKMFVLGILAGVFIAFGAEASSLAAHNMTLVGITRLVTGCVFPVGLIMVVLLGSELFTGNCLMVGALFNRKIGIGRLLRNWVVVYLGNLVGSLIIVELVNLTGQLGYSSNALAAFTIKIAASKVALGFGAAFVSGILCNILVCVAVLLASASKTIIGKIVAIWFPIMAFVVSGFEHSIANMYYIPAGMLAAMNPAYADAAHTLYGTSTAGLTLSGFLDNLVPVTLGNIVGGILIGTAMWFCYGRRKAAAAN